MSFQVKDRITPAIARRLRAVKDTRPVLEAMGTEGVSLTKRAFTDAALRPSPWAPLKPSTLARKKGSILRESGAMWQSIRITETTAKSVAWGSDRKYAAIQQLGGQAGKGGKVTLPPRPFFPVLNGKITPAARVKIDLVAKKKIDSLLS